MPVSQEDFDALAATVSQLSADLATVTGNLANLDNVVSGHTTAIGQLTADMEAAPGSEDVAQMILEAQPGYGLAGWWWPTVYDGGYWHLTEMPWTSLGPEVAEGTLFWKPGPMEAKPGTETPKPRVVKERNVVIAGKLVKQRQDT
jgi:hypothetical protein